MTVELLYFEGCPGYEALVPLVRELLSENGVQTDIELRAVDTADDAQAERFLGSPSLRVDGRDVEPGADERTDFGLKCRIYRAADGASPVPRKEWIRDALREAEGATA